MYDTAKRIEEKDKGIGKILMIRNVHGGAKTGSVYSQPNAINTKNYSGHLTSGSHT